MNMISGITSETLSTLCVLAEGCQNFALVRSKFLNRIFEIKVEFRNVNDLTLTFLLLFGSEKQPSMSALRFQI